MAYIEMNGAMRILVVDSDPVNAQAIRQYLKRIGYTNSAHETTGYDAIHRIRRKEAQFVLCRMNVPVMDGPMVFEEMKSDFAIERVPFAIFEERMSNEDVALLKEYGVDGTLSLPFVQKDLAELLARTWSRYIDKANPEYLFEQGRRLFVTGQLGDATKIFRALLERKVHPERALVGLGLVAKKENDLPRALEYAQRVVAEQPDYVRGLQLVGEVQLALGNRLEAIDAFSRAIQLSPKNPYRYEVVCDLLGGIGMWAEAEQLFRKALGLGLDFPRLQSGLAGALANLGRHADAIALYEELVRKHPKDPSFLNNMAACHKNSGNLVAASETYRRALELDGRNTRIMFNLALLLVARGEKEGAKALLRKAVSLDPAYAKARSKLDELEGRVVTTPEPEPEETKTDVPVAQQARDRIQKAIGVVQQVAEQDAGLAERERSLIEGATEEQIRAAFSSLALRMRVALVEVMDGYASLVGTLSSDVVAVLGETTQVVDQEVSSEGMSESTVLVLTALQFQDELTQLLSGLKRAYRIIVEKGLKPSNADFQEIVKLFPVEAWRKRLVAVASDVVKAQRSPFRERGFIVAEAVEKFALELLAGLADGIRKSHDGLGLAVEGFRRTGKASEDVVTALAGSARHFVILARRVSSLRDMLDTAVREWLFLENGDETRRSLLRHGKDLRGLWPRLEACCETPEERSVVREARMKSMEKPRSAG